MEKMYTFAIIEIIYMRVVLLTLALWGRIGGEEVRTVRL